MAARNFQHTTIRLCKHWLRGRQALLGWRPFSFSSAPPDPPDEEGGPPHIEYDTSLLEENVGGERPHYKTSVLGDESLANMPDYNPVIAEDGDGGELKGMEELAEYELEYDDRDMLRGYRVNREDQLLELEKLPILHVRCTHNNTMISICDHKGHVKAWKSCGSEGYKNARKGTTIAAQATGQAAARKALQFGYHKVRVKLKGLGVGRHYSLKGFELGGVHVASIQDVTPVPHNGCKPKKKRRI